MSRSSNTPATPVSNPASAQGVEAELRAFIDEQRAFVDRNDADLLMIPRADFNRNIGRLNRIARTLASPSHSRDAAVPASGGVSINDRLRATVEALEPFATSCDNHFHSDAILDTFDDDASVLMLVRDGKLSPTGVSVGDLRRAKQVYLASLSPAPTSGPEAGGKPWAWARRWAYDRIDVMKMKKAERPRGWYLQDVTRSKILPDDVALYLAKPASEPAGGGVYREAAYKAAWEHADDEVGWEATKSLAAAGNIYIQGQVDWHREMVDKAIAAALSSAPATPSPAEAEAKEGR